MQETGGVLWARRGLERVKWCALQRTDAHATRFPARNTLAESVLVRCDLDFPHSLRHYLGHCINTPISQHGVSLQTAPGLDRLRGMHCPVDILASVLIIADDWFGHQQGHHYVSCRIRH